MFRKGRALDNYKHDRNMFGGASKTPCVMMGGGDSWVSNIAK